MMTFASDFQINAMFKLIFYIFQIWYKNVHTFFTQMFTRISALCLHVCVYAGGVLLSLGLPSWITSACIWSLVGSAT